MKFQILRKVLLFFFFLATSFVFSYCYSQSCPSYDKRNNGAGTTGCHSSDSPPNIPGSSPLTAKVKSGQFDFTNSSTSTGLLVDSIFLNGQLYQQGQTLYNSLGTIWFGNYSGSTSKIICFYGDSQSDNAPPAGRWRFKFTTQSSPSTTLSCNYTLLSNGNLSSFDPGTISSSQVICTGETPTQITGTAPSGCTSPLIISYQWRQSTDGTTYTDVSSSGTSSSYSPGALTQTTRFIRVATCSDGATASSDPVVITVLNAGTLNPQPGSTWSGSTTTFSSNGTSGGAWSITTSPASGVATIDPSSGVLTATGAGTGTVTYTVTSGSTTCSSTRNFTISGTSGSLPVTWESVSAQKKNGQVFLQWSTASEQNTKDFEIHYSPNTVNWNSLGVVQAAGNSSVTKNYSFIHESPLKNNNYNYYRILQRDIDGKSSYSKIVSVMFNEPGDDIMIYPNPAADVLNIYMAEEQEVTISNSAGSTVWQSKMPAGKSQVALHRFSAGVYLLRTPTQTRRFVIK